MKQSIRGTFRKLAVVAGVSICAVLATPSTSKANIGIDSVQEKEKQSNVQYLGSYDSSVWFNIKYANPAAEKFTLVIKNADGDVLYQGQFTDVNFSKKIKLLVDGEDVNPTFIIRSGNKQLMAQSFQVNTATRLIEQVVVTKL
jgi:hypothetical protein